MFIDKNQGCGDIWGIIFRRLGIQFSLVNKNSTVFVPKQFILLPNFWKFSQFRFNSGSQGFSVNKNIDSSVCWIALCFISDLTHQVSLQRRSGLARYWSSYSLTSHSHMRNWAHSIGGISPGHTEKELFFVRASSMPLPYTVYWKASKPIFLARSGPQ